MAFFSLVYMISCNNPLKITYVQCKRLRIKQQWSRMCKNYKHRQPHFIFHVKHQTHLTRNLGNFQFEQFPHPMLLQRVNFICFISHYPDQNQPHPPQNTHKKKVPILKYFLIHLSPCKPQLKQPNFPLTGQFH